MTILKSAPPLPVTSLGEFFAIAHALEHEAAVRYGELAERARNDGIASLAELFERLATEERTHEQMVTQWAEQRSGQPVDPSKLRWQPSEIFDEGAAGELAASRLASAYRILSMAVRNEERAFAFWAHVAAGADVPDIRQAAERMAHEELRHVALLRSARRQAYHAERAGKPREPPHTVAELFADAELLEHRMAVQLEKIAAGAGDERAERARLLAGEARDMAEEAAQLARNAAAAPIAPELAPEAIAERLTDDYLDAADRTRNESVMAAAQSLARRAILRLAWLRRQPG